MNGYQERTSLFNGYMKRTSLFNWCPTRIPIAIPRKSSATAAKTSIIHPRSLLYTLFAIRVRCVGSSPDLLMSGPAMLIPVRQPT